MALLLLIRMEDGGLFQRILGIEDEQASLINKNPFYHLEVIISVFVVHDIRKQ